MIEANVSEKTLDIFFKRNIVCSNSTGHPLTKCGSKRETFLKFYKKVMFFDSYKVGGAPYRNIIKTFIVLRKIYGIFCHCIPYWFAKFGGDPFSRFKEIFK